MSEELDRLNKEHAEVVLSLTMTTTIDDGYFKLMRKERELKAAMLKLNEPELEVDVLGNARLWSEKEINVLRLHYKKEGPHYVAARLSRSAEGCRYKAASLGLQMFTHKKKKSA